MRIDIGGASARAAVLTLLAVAPARAQHAGHAAPDSALHAIHNMWSASLGAGWQLVAMAQAFPALTFGAPFGTGPLRRTGGYLTQPAVMANFLSPGGRIVLRATLNFEGVTQPEGELTYGGWGEGFIDKRHPHTLVHELVLSFNAWELLGGQASVSAGKSFAPFGTDDPMSRPALKYPTNHHLSQILERWTLQGIYLRGGWSLEAGLFGGTEPDGPYDFSNITPFGNSWSVRAAHRWGEGEGPVRAWEASVSYGSVVESHEDGADRTPLWNAAVRHESARGYGLIEASRAGPEDAGPFFSVLAEAQVVRDRHRPYARLEYATRPEFIRLGPPGSDGFFRYDHDAQPIGATRWLIATAGYGYEATRYPFSVRPFIDVQYFRVREERGGTDPRALYGRTGFWGISLGARVFIGGDPMRMGTYGVLDPMTTMHRVPADSTVIEHGGHGGADRAPPAHRIEGS